MFAKMSKSGETLRPRSDEFAKTELTRGMCAELDADETGFYLLLVRYEFLQEANYWLRFKVFRKFTNAEIIEVAEAYRLYFASSRFPGCEDYSEEELEKLSWVKGLDLCAILVRITRRIAQLEEEHRRRLPDEADFYLREALGTKYDLERKKWHGPNLG